MRSARSWRRRSWKYRSLLMCMAELPFRSGCADSKRRSDRAGKDILPNILPKTYAHRLARGASCAGAKRSVLAIDRYEKSLLARAHDPTTSKEAVMSADPRDDLPGAIAPVLSARVLAHLQQLN